MSSLQDPCGFHRGRSPRRDTYDTSMLAESSGSGPSSPRTPSSASKFMLNVRRSLSYGGQSKKHSPTLADIGMRSTPEESLPPSPATRGQIASPTIEEIAMGLHISRTPHISPLHPHHPRSRRRQSVDITPIPQSALASRRASLQVRGTHRRRDSTPTLMLPPPPPRSSLKKSSSTAAGTRMTHSSTSPLPLTPSASDASLSSLPSSVPSTPRSTRSANASLFSSKFQSRMSKLLPLRRSTTSSDTTVHSASDDDSASSRLTPRKVVRFSTGVGDAP